MQTSTPVLKMRAIRPPDKTRTRRAKLRAIERRKLRKIKSQRGCAS